MQILRLHLNTAAADYDRLIRKGSEILHSKKRQLRIQVQLRGREKASPKAGLDLLQKATDDLSTVSTVARPATTKNLSVTFNPKR